MELLITALGHYTKYSKSSFNDGEHPYSVEQGPIIAAWEEGEKGLESPVCGGGKEKRADEREREGTTMHRNAGTGHHGALDHR
jgi:hypothetical protein